MITSILVFLTGFFFGDIVGALTGFSVFTKIGAFFKTLEAKALARVTAKRVAAMPSFNPMLPSPGPPLGATGPVGPFGPANP